MAEGTPPHWNIYFNVDSADDTASRVKELGGDVMAEPFDIPGVGRMAVFTDPTGAMFNVMHAGKAIFEGEARCAGCHVPPLFTEPGWNLHKAEEIGIDDFQAKRSPDERYRTASLRALWDMEKVHKRGFYHDGRFATLNDVVDHYDGHFKLNLNAQEKRNLIEYLKSI